MVRLQMKTDRHADSCYVYTRTRLSDKVSSMDLFQAAILKIKYLSNLQTDSHPTINTKFTSKYYRHSKRQHNTTLLCFSDIGRRQLSNDRPQWTSGASGRTQFQHTQIYVRVYI